MPLSNLDHHVSLSFVAAHGSDKSLLRTILDTYSLIQEQVVLASKLVTTPVTNGDIDVDTDESELLKEKVYFLQTVLFLFFV
jgi:carbonic anhydrase/acetyltransferase-like protein (isoleucine patch superfamily)